MMHVRNKETFKRILLSSGIRLEVTKNEITEIIMLSFAIDAYRCRI